MISERELNQRINALQISSSDQREWIKILLPIIIGGAEDGGYATIEDLADALTTYVETGDLTSTLADYVETADLTTTLGDYTAKDNLPVNILDFGADPTGLTDSTDAIQAAIDERLGLYLPPGIFAISDTLTFPATFPSAGTRVIGSGRAVSNAFTGSRQGPATILRWDGSVGGTMLLLPSAAGLIMESFTLAGKSSAVATNLAGKLIHMDLVLGYGSGCHSFRALDLQFATVGIQVMDAQADTNGDTSSLDHVQFFACDTGFLAKNDQAMGWDFRNLYANQCPRVLDFEYGSFVTVNTASFNACGGNDATQDYCIRVRTSSSNNHTGVFANLRVENGTKGVAQLKGYGKYHFIGFNEGQVDQNCKQFDFDGPMVTFESSRFLTQDSTTRPFKHKTDAGGRRNGLIFRGCNFAGTTNFNLGDWVEVDTNSNAYIKIDGCTRHANDAPIPDRATQTAWGNVLVYGETTDATPRNLSLDGASSLGNQNVVVVNADTALIFDVFVVGKEQSAANYATFHRRASAVNNGGTVTLSSVQTIGTDVNVPTWAVAVTNSGTQIRVQVTGAAATTIDWTATIVARQVG
jgi:hypothetical protein